MLETQIHLKGTPADGFAGHKVEIRYRVNADNPSLPTDLQWLPREKHVAADANGRGAAMLPSGDDLIGPALFLVRAPDGELLLSAEFPPPTIGGVWPVELTVNPKNFAETADSDVPYRGRRTRLNGRVLDLAGKVMIAFRQVTIWARTKDDPPGDFSLALAAQTDGKGYFFGDVPPDRFAEAYAVVAGSGGQKIPVRLDAGGLLPLKLLLAVALDAAALEEEEPDCACGVAPARLPDAAELLESGAYTADIGGGSCVDFTVPNRSLEEFSYFYVVRTTEPAIRGTTGVGGPGGVHNGNNPPLAGRGELNAENPVDWDDDPTFFQAATIAHGHLLHMKQVWKADGYSLGDLLYSLPLAPLQKKQIAVVDWERRDTAMRGEASDYRDQLSASLTRDRDISEIVNSTLTESLKGGSESSSWGLGFGSGAAGSGSYGGFSLGAVIGNSAGIGSSSSSAWQDSSRNASASSLQQLRDRTMQAASSVRSQRTTVVQSVSQSESVRVQTEVVANHNHCHAITIEYFEVLRHLAVESHLDDVQECLLVPLLMSRFDHAKTLRWRSPLERGLRRPDLAGGFDAIERIEASYVGSDLPSGTYADDLIQDISGELRIRFSLARPADKDGAFDAAAWAFWGLLGIGGLPQDVYNRYLAGQALMDRAFQDSLAPRIAAQFVQALEFRVFDAVGASIVLPVDATLVSDYRDGVSLYVSLRLARALPPLTRGWVYALQISDRSRHPRPGTGGPVSLFELLPAHSKITVESGSIRYSTAHYYGYLFSDYWIQNDLGGSDVVRVQTPLNRDERRNPREEDKQAARRLVGHLNEYIEYYHRVVWYFMDPERRFMLLDGFTAPNAKGRSVASVVENRLVGFVGNSMVLPVARGFHLDPTYRQDKDRPVDLLAHYAPTTPIPPSRISLPTRGVFAEAVMGACNACEKKDDTRFWRFEESPNPDQPAAIANVGAETRAQTPPDLKAKDYPAPIINLQNAPAAPDPSGLDAAFKLLGTPNLFRDMAGLEGTQKNSIEAYKKALDTALSFGQEASKLAQSASLQKNGDKTMETIKKAKDDKLITDDQAKALTNETLRGMIGSAGKPGAGGLGAIQDALKSGLISKEDAQKLAKDLLGHLNAPEGGKTEKPTTSKAAEDLIKAGTADGSNVAIRDADGAAVEVVRSDGFLEVAENYGDVVHWRHLITFTTPADIVTAIGARGMKLQTLFDDLSSDVVNLDYYPVRITKLPKIDGGTATPEALLKYLRLNFNNFIDTSLSKFTPYEAADEVKWKTDDHRGAALYIAIPIVGPIGDNAAVVCSEAAADHWIFSTISTPRSGSHPVSGNRMFGLFPRGDGEWVFFTKGADRTTGFFETRFDSTAFSQADKLWRSLQAKVTAAVVAGGGAAEVLYGETYSRRFNWAGTKRAFGLPDVIKV